MFKIEGHKTLIKDLHKIVNNKLVLYNDGEYDIIYTGTNSFGNRILCCIMLEDDDDGFLRFINALITEIQYEEFMNKKLSLLSILKTNDSFFIVDYDYGLRELSSNLVSLDEIPTEFHPLENSFCPDIIFEPSFNYSVSMQGGLADEHKISTKSLISVSSSFNDFLKSSTEFINELDFERVVYVEALRTGSFKINFKVEVSEPIQTSLLDFPKEEINLFLNNYFNYVFNQLPNENVDIFQKDIVDSEKFKTLENELKGLYDKKGIAPDAGVEHKLIDLINYSINGLKNIEYNDDFENIQFINISDKGDEIPFASINDELVFTIDERLFNLEEFKAEDIILVDEKPKNYTFQVFQFNTDTGNGKAYFKEPNDSIHKISVYAKGRENYQNTTLTQSLHERLPFDFSGVGKYVNNNLKSITINLD